MSGPGRRAFVVVLDACGVGALPDAAEYGDASTNTLGHLADEVGGLELPALGRLGLGSIVALIVYTSQDSVLQIAAHVDVLEPDGLYAICARVREALPADHAVGRVIARPFAGSLDAWRRTEGRRDFSIVPPARSYLEELQDAGVEVHAVGKVGQLFAGVGIDAQHPGATNARAIAETTELIRSLPAGFVFTNLVETDQVYGHRHDVVGFHQALREIDAAVVEWLALRGPHDMLVLTADHGCDPTSPRTDHTREYAPLLAAFEGHGSRRHDGSLADVGASVLAWLAGRNGAAARLPGESFVPA